MKRIPKPGDRYLYVNSEYPWWDKQWIAEIINVDDNNVTFIWRPLNKTIGGYKEEKLSQIPTDWQYLSSVEKDFNTWLSTPEEPEGLICK